MCQFYTIYGCSSECVTVRHCTRNICYIVQWTIVYILIHLLLVKVYLEYSLRIRACTHACIYTTTLSE